MTRPARTPLALARPLAGLVALLSIAAPLLSACNDPTPAAATAPAPVASASPEASPAEPAGPSLPDAATLLADSVITLGGADNLLRLRSYYSESVITMTGMGLRGVVKTWWQGGDFYTETDIPGVGLSRLGSKDGRVWSDDPINNFREISGVEAEQAAWTSTPCLVHNWEKYFKSATTTAVIEDGERKLAEILFVSPLGDQVTLRIDMATKIPVEQRFSQANTLGAMPVKATFSDFREVEGFKISFSQDVDASLSKISATTTRFDANVLIDPSRFDMPGAGALYDPDAVKDAPTEDDKKASKRP